jgi:hypothetical protein
MSPNFVEPASLATAGADRVSAKLCCTGHMTVVRCEAVRPRSMSLNLDAVAKWAGRPPRSASAMISLAQVIASFSTASKPSSSISLCPCLVVHRRERRRNYRGMAAVGSVATLRPRDHAIAEPWHQPVDRPGNYADDNTYRPCCRGRGDGLRLRRHCDGRATRCGVPLRRARATRFAVCGRLAITRPFIACRSLSRHCYSTPAKGLGRNRQFNL